MRTLRVAFSTLGCKLNQLETEALADAFSEAGASLVPFEGRADLYVLNTCTVTGKAEQKARRALRQAAARNPEAAVVATGCYAQMEPMALQELSPRLIVVSGDEKTRLLSLASWLQDNWQGHGDLRDAISAWSEEGGAQASEGAPGQGSSRFAFHPRSFVFHTRPSLKVQDGCDNRCAYCRVCIARGPSVSLDPAQALERARELEAAGKAELVLTGVNLSQYRWGELRFPGLMRLLIDGTERIRLRLSSWEPERADQAFLEAFAHPRVQPHLHLSLQSGSDGVLRRMARPYTAERVREAVRALRAVKGDLFLAADLIAGFPGETEAEFEETAALLAELDLAYIHAFRFSARPGTKAWDMRPKTPERLAGERVERLTALADLGKAAYIRRWTGRAVPLVLESPGAEDSVPEGTAANYLKLRLAASPPGLTPGALVEARILGPSPSSGVDAEAVFVRPL